MTQLEYDIAELEKKQKETGLVGEEKERLHKLQEEWIKIESSKYGPCLSCCI